MHRVYRQSNWHYLQIENEIKKISNYSICTRISLGMFIRVQIRHSPDAEVSWTWFCHLISVLPLPTPFIGMITSHHRLVNEFVCVCAVLMCCALITEIRRIDKLVVKTVSPNPKIIKWQKNKERKIPVQSVFGWSIDWASAIVFLIFELPFSFSRLLDSEIIMIIQVIKFIRSLALTISSSYVSRAHWHTPYSNSYIHYTRTNQPTNKQNNKFISYLHSGIVLHIFVVFIWLFSWVFTVQCTS